MSKIDVDLGQLSAMQEQAVTKTGTEEDDEPRLKYQRLGASVSEILETAAASSLCVSEKILALGTHTGSVHVLDVSGNEVWSARLLDNMCPAMP